MAYDLDTISAGLNGPEVDRSFWRQKAEMRVHALEEDGEMFGLVPAEEIELVALKGLLKSPPASCEAREQR